MPDMAGLFDSFLEAAVSLAVLFVIVAWISSKIVELGQLTFNVHGKMLRDELERCFGEEDGPNKRRFTHYFYWHPMIVPLTQPSLLVSIWRRIRGWFGRREGDTAADLESRFPPGRLPGHIAPESFAAVVMNPFPWPTTEEPLRRLLKANLVDAAAVSDSSLDEAIRTLIRRGQSLNPGETWRALLERLGIPLGLNDEFLDSRVDIHGPSGAAGRGDPAERYIEMCRANELVPHPLETRIVTLLRDADSDLDEFRGGLRRWYSEAMARVTGRFKRTALVWVFVVALAICGLFNLNAINLFSALMKSPELRAAGVEASRAIGTKPGGIEALTQKVEFSDVYQRCAAPKPAATPAAEQPPAVAQPAAVSTPAASRPMPDEECRLDLLNSLWRDSRKFNPVKSLFAEKRKAADETASALPQPSSQGAGAPAAVEKTGQVNQVQLVQGLCEQDAELCTAPFKARLTACLEPGRGYPPDQCNPAWNAIWTSSGFFWHPEAANKLALNLMGQTSGEADGLPATLYGVHLHAEGETKKVVKFIGDLPDLGPVWKDKRFEGVGVLWSLFGILLSALLAALGAPFWYDVLGKLSRRGTSGARGEKT
jgi:hypothetical protein